MAEAYIVSAVRTAGGRRNGALAGWHPASLGAQVLDAVVSRSGVDPAAVDDVLMGCVSQIGDQSANVGRNAVLASSLPQSVPAVTIDRQCGSSQQAIHFAAQAVMSGTQDIVIAAGVESMTRVPIGSPSRLAIDAGLGNGPMSDEIRRNYPVDNHSQFDGAEMLATKYGLSRAEMDLFALQSHRRASEAIAAGVFDDEILPIPVTAPEGACMLHRHDEGVRHDATLEAISGVRLLRENGRLTAATSSQICDGAAAVMVVSEQALRVHGLTPLARIHNLTVTAGDPIIMLEEPVGATERALRRTGMKINDIDFYEVNEAFASVPLAWLKATGADPDRLNVRGGGISLGHPLGASGAKLMTTLIHALRSQGKRFGLQTMCEGGGLANLAIIEAL